MRQSPDLISDLTGSDANREVAIRSYLPTGTPSVYINARGQTVAQGTILKSEYGIAVVVGNNNINPAFASLCKTEIINKEVIKNFIFNIYRLFKTIILIDG